VQETIWQYSKTICCAGNGFAAQQNDLPRRKTILLTPKQLNTTKIRVLDLMAKETEPAVDKRDLA
jgi:hypothetical protein